MYSPIYFTCRCLYLYTFSSEYWGGDQVMDPETAAAYEQFLREMRGSAVGSTSACREPSNGEPSCNMNGVSGYQL